MKLYWKEGMMNAYLVAPKMPRRDQVIFARIYVKMDQSNVESTEILGWKSQIYLTALYPNSATSDGHRPMELPGTTQKTFTQCRKITEATIIDFFKGAGIEVEIEQPTFANDRAWKIRAK